MRSFGFPDQCTGGGPGTPLLKSREGVYYGTTRYGGLANIGTIFRVNPDGSGFATIYSFTNAGWPQYGGFLLENEQLPLVEGPDDGLYGASVSGNYVYRLNKDGSGFSVFYKFSQAPGSVFCPESLMLGSDGALYGTGMGGTNDLGAVFRLTLDLTNCTILHHFAGGPDDGSNPTGGLVEDADGVLYGVTVEGGTTSQCPECVGALYKLNKDGSGYARLHQFVITMQQKAPPKDGLLLGSDGRFYGVTAYASVTNQGSVYAIDRTGQNVALLHEFTGGINGFDPSGPLSEGPDGAVYGLVKLQTNMVQYTAVFRINRDGSGYTNLLSLPSEGYGLSHAISILDDHIVGTSGAIGQYRDGNVFRLNLDGSGYEALVQFNSRGGDGSYPTHLISDLEGWLHGVTGVGGNSGHGTVFKIQPNGSNYTQLFHFAGTNGSYPDRLVDGWPAPVLYGTTREGGSMGRGVIFRIDKTGDNFQVLHHFGEDHEGRFDGKTPIPVLFQSNDEMLYGATDDGGLNDDGIIFRIQTNGQNYQVIHNFSYNSYEGARPTALIEDVQHTLYVSTLNWSYHPGAILKMNKDGSGFDVLTSFSRSYFWGYDLPRSLAEGYDGFLYFTLNGETLGQGYLCRISKTNTFPGGYTILHTFSGNEGTVNTFPACLQMGEDWIMGLASGYQLSPANIFAVSRDGRNFALPYTFTNQPFPIEPSRLTPGPPVAGGALYGTTSSGGAQNFGTIFRFHSPPIVATNANALFTRLGASATLQTPSAGSGPGFFRWQFNGADIATEIAGKKNFIVSNVTPETCGNYTLVVTNAWGAATSAPIALSVFSAERESANIQLTVLGGPGMRYEFRNQATIDDFSWPLTSFRLSSNSFIWSEPISTTQCFYRAVFLGK